MNGQPTGGGWVKLHREILEHRDFKNGEWLKLWVWMLLKATHKPYPYRFNGNPITLQPGQFVTCRKDMAREVRLHESSIQRLIKRMKSEQQIEQLTSNASSLFTITNWNHYQQIEQQIEHPANSQRTASEQPANHKQEQKNKITEEQKNKDTASADADTANPSEVQDSAEGSKRKNGYHKDARAVLHVLNEASGMHYREVDTNLGIITQRLNEPEVTFEGVKAMILRQALKWPAGDKMREYLRPATLFCKSKFDGYYAAKDMPVVSESNAKPTHQAEANLARDTTIVVHEMQF